MFLFSKIDLLGVPATFNFFGDEKRRSNFGGLCTLLFIAFVVYSAYNSSLDLVNRANPKVTLSELNVEDPRLINITLDVFPIAFIVQGSTAVGGAGFTNESIYTIKVEEKVIERVLQPDGSYKKVTTRTPLQVEKCTKEYFGDYAASFSTFTFLGSYCISKNQTGLDKLKMQGLYSSTIYQAITATVVACDQNTSSVQCASQDVINKFMSGSYFNAVYLDSMLNMENFTNPTAKYRELYTTLMNPASYKQVSINVGVVDVSTDSGILFEQTNTQSVFKVKTTSEIVDQNPNPSKNLLFCAFQSSRTDTYYTRSYKKIPTVLAEVGSLANAFLGIVLIIISPYLRIKSREALMNELYDVEGKLALQRKNKRKNTFSEWQPSSGSTKKVRIEENKDIKNKLKPKDLRLTTLSKTLTTEGVFSRETYLTYPNEILQETPRSDYELKDNLDSERHILGQPRSRRDGTVQALFYRSEKKRVSNKDAEQPQTAVSSFQKSLLTSPETASPHRLIADSHRVRRMNGDKVEDKEFDQMMYKNEELEEDDIEKQLKNIDIAKTKEKTIQEVLEVEKLDIGDIPPPSDDRIASCSDREYRIEQDKKENVTAQKKRRGALKNGFQPETKDTLKNEDVKTKNTELHIWEYVLSFFYKPKCWETKIKMIEEGVKDIEQKLDVSHILKKFSELDKMKTLFFDRDQLELFNNMPKPQLQRPRIENYLDKPFERSMWKTMTTLETLKNEDYMQMSYERIKKKESKSDIDRRLIDIFRDEFFV